MKTIADSAPGWGMVWDIGNGLESVWLCSVCVERAREAMRSLRDVLRGREVGHINFLPLLRDL